MIPRLPNGEREMSSVELAQALHDDLREKGFEGEILNNSLQLLKKIQDSSKELSNVDHVEDDGDTEEEDTESEDNVFDEADGEDGDEEDDSEANEELPDYASMSKDDMKKDLKSRGIINIIIQ